MKTAILQVADTGPLESLVIMLRSVGYDCYIPNNEIKQALRAQGCDTVLDIEGLVRNWGYSQPMSLPDASLRMMDTTDLYVEIKAQRNAVKIWRRWPRLKSRTLWYRINGGYPEITERGGDEVNLVCPILTPDLWYAEDGPWKDRAYVCWPPFYRQDEYYPVYGRTTEYTSPICLTHNVAAWGFRALIEPMRELGIKCYGCASPDGLIQHGEVAKALSSALAMVHLKPSDAPGYSLYETLAAACPVVVSRKLLYRNHMEDMFIDGETCILFDRPTHEPFSEQDVFECLRDVKAALERLRDPTENARIGMNGRKRLLELMWDENKDSASLKRWMERMYG